MKVAVVSDFREVLEKQLKPNGLQVDEKNPEVVLSLGGDGTFLLAEYKYPGIPKLFIKHYSDCKTCSKHDFSTILQRLRKKNYKIFEWKKLEARINGELEFTSMNDINLHYKVPRAVRFRTFVNEKEVNGVIIGDGVVVATPHGSSGYFQSITKKTFKTGIGLAFNNVRNPLKHLLLSYLDKVKIKIERAPALLAADSQSRVLELKDNDVVEISVSGQKAKIIQFDDLRVTKY